MIDNRRRTDDQSTRLLAAIHTLEAEADEWEFVDDGAETRSELMQAVAIARFARRAYIESTGPSYLGLTIASVRALAEGAETKRMDRVDA